MENKETRYAIIIGIDDYDSSPLRFCSNDAKSIKESLIENCMFEEENIFKITSTEEKSEKDITGKYLSAVREIKSKFIEGTDSIFFYFAGHGSSEHNGSVIWFQESAYPIEDIFKNISSLNPKVQMYMIDSCQSGSKVLTRSKDDELTKYINAAEGVMFLYACTNTQYASELPSLEHGLLTYYLLEAISNKDLYDDGYLTFNRIVDFVQKETSKNSNFRQIPVIENRITGFYPFAIDNDKPSIDPIEKNGILTGEERNISNLLQLRLALQEKARLLMENSLSKVNFKEYESTNVDNFDGLNYDGVSKLEEKVVDYVINQKLTPLKNLIYREVEKREYNNPIYGGILKSIDIWGNKPKEIIHNIINFNSTTIDSKFNIYISNDINKVSFGVGYINYQAKWGLVILKIVFLIDWDGESDNEIKSVKIDSIPILLEEKSLQAIENIDININKYINEKVNSWNLERKEELGKYRINL